VILFIAGFVVALFVLAPLLAFSDRHVLRQNYRMRKGFTRIAAVLADRTPNRDQRKEINIIVREFTK